MKCSEVKVTILGHGALWHNGGQVISCPECRSTNVDADVIEDESTSQVGNSTVAGPGAMCQCRACACKFFVERVEA